jgi:hypothetical protein
MNNGAAECQDQSPPPPENGSHDDSGRVTSTLDTYHPDRCNKTVVERRPPLPKLGPYRENTAISGDALRSKKLCGFRRGLAALWDRPRLFLWRIAS